MSNKLNQLIVKTGLTKAKGVVLASLLFGGMALPFLMPVQKAQADNGDSGRGGNPDALLGTWVVQVSGDEFTVSSQVDIILPNGTVLPFHPAATSHGTRMTIEPLN